MVARISSPNCLPTELLSSISSVLAGAIRTCASLDSNVPATAALVICIMRSLFQINKSGLFQ